VQKTPDDVFIYSCDMSLTYKSVYESVLRLANHFNHLGIKKHTRVVVMLPNIPEMIYTWLALSRLEAMMIPVNVHYKSLALRYIIDDSSATAIVYHADNEEDVLSATSILNSCEVFVGVGECKNDKAVPFDEYSSKPFFGGPYRPEEHDTSVMFYSGAATGPAKYAKYSNYQLYRNTNDFLSAVIYKPDDIVFSQYPLTHFIAYVGVMNALLNAGASIAICDTDDDEQLKKTFKSARPTYLVAEPSYFKHLVQKADSTFLPDSMRYAITGGGRLKKNIIEAFRKIYNLPVFKVYGMVEAGPILTVNTNTDKPDSIGIPLSKVSIALKNGKSIVNEEIIGEICIVSEVLTKDLQELLKEQIRDGWYHTGDLARVDMDGYYYFIDRKAYVINVRGFDVYPEQLESLLMKHPMVKDAVVVGALREDGTESIQAHIIPESGKRPDDEALKAFLSEELPPYQIPEGFSYVTHFPKSATGKVVRQALKKKIKPIMEEI